LRRKEQRVKIVLLLIIVLAGAAMPLEAALNAKVGQATHSPAFAALVSFAVGVSVCLLLTVSGVMGRPQLGQAGTLPWWVWTGGALGAMIVVVSLVAVRQVGAAVLITATVLGQVVLALAMDAGGWFGVPKVPINPWRVVGGILVCVGVVLTTRK
jgi:transporter family-2 protein